MAKSRVGICFLDRPDLDTQVRCAKLADELGYDSIWPCETRLARDAATVMGAFAVVTNNIKIAPGVVNSWTRGAPLMAMTFATLHELSHGRVMLGVGAYWEPLAWKQGIERSKPVKQMREYVKVLRALWNMERITFAGEFVKVRDLELDLGYGVEKQPLPIPIYIGATGPQMLEASGEIADGVLLNAMTSPEYTRDAVERIRKGAEKVGRKLEDIDRPQLITVSMGKDGKAARENAKYLITMYLGQQPHIGKASGLTEDYVESLKAAMGGWPPAPGGIPRAMKLVNDDVVDTFTVAGTPEQCLERAKDYVRAGASCVVPLVASEDAELIIRTFAEFNA